LLGFKSKVLETVGGDDQDV